MEKKKSNLPFSVVYGYGLGEFGYNFFITFLAYYLLVFLQQIAGFNPTMAATIFTFTTVIKWVTMPIAGSIIDSTQLKGGQYRPWLLIGSLMMVVGGTLCFTRLMAPGVGYAIVYLVCFFVCYLGYSLMWVSYRGLMDPMCTDPADKVSLSTESAALGALARIFYVFGAVTLVQSFSDPAKGYSVVGLLFTVIIFLCMLAVSAITKKYDNAELRAAAAQKAPAQKLTLKDIANTIGTKPMLIYSLTMLFRISVIAIVPTLLVYYLTYVLNDYSIMVPYMMVSYFVSFIGALVVKPITTKLGKKPTFIITTLISAAFLILARFITGKVAFTAVMSLWQFTGIFASSLVPAFMADIAEYSRLTKGGRAAGMVYSVGGLVVQLGSFFGGIIASFGQVVVGFDANNPTPAGISGLAALMTFGAAAVSIIAALIFMLYPLTEKYMEKLREEHKEA